MATYEVEAPNGKTYEVEGPAGADHATVVQAILAQYPEAGVKPTIGGYAKEAVKGLGRGAVGLFQSAGIGASALLPEELEKPVAKKIQELADRPSLRAAPGYAEAVPTRLAEGVGSMLGTLAIPGGVIGRGLALGASGAGEARQRAQQAGATPEEISSATAQGIAPGLMDLLPVHFLLGRAGKVALDGIISRGVRAAATGSVEGVTEAAQEILQNAIAQGYDPSQGLYEGAGEAGTYGSAVGAIAQGLFDLALPGRARRMRPVQREAAETQPEIAPPVVQEPVTQEPVALQEVAPPVTEAPITEAPITTEAVLATETPQTKPVEAPAEAAAPEAKKPVKIEKPVTVEQYQAEIERLKAELPNAKSAGHRAFIVNKIARYEAALAAAPGVTPAVDAKTLLKQPKVPTNEPITPVAGVGAEGRGASVEQPVPSGVPGEPSVAAPDVARVGSVEPTARGPVGGEEVQSGALKAEAPAVPVRTEVVVPEVKQEAPAPETKKEAPAPEVVPAERQKRIAEYEQLEDAPKAVRNYHEHYQSIDKAIQAVGFDLAEKTKKGEMGYVKEGGAPAQQFADWVRELGTPEQKAALDKSQAGYAKLKAKAESKEVIEAREKPQETRLAGKKQLALEELQAGQKELTREEKADIAAEKERQDLEAVAKAAAKKTAKSKRMEDRAGEADLEEDVDRDEALRKLFRASKGEAAAPTGHTTEGVTKALKNHFKEDSRFDAMTTVVQSEADLPEEIRKAKDYARGTRGVAHKGKVWLVADNIEPGRELGVFLHEAGAHLGFDGVMKASDRQFLADQVRKWGKGKDDLVETKAAKVALEKGGESNDEIIAYMTEELVNRGVKPTSFRPANTWLRRVVEAFKKALKKIGLRGDIAPQELVEAAYGAAHIQMKAPGKAVEGAPRFSQANPAMDAVDARTLRLVSGAPAPQSIVQRAYQTALNPRPEKFFQNLRQSFANKNTWWEDWVTSLQGNNALDTAGAASALDRIQASTKVDGIKLATLEKGGFRKGKNGLWEAYDTDASYKDIVERVHQMVGKYKATPDFDSAQAMFNLAATAKREEGLIKSGQIGPGKIQRTLTDAQLKQGLGVFNATPEIQDALKLYKKFNDRNVDTLVTSGVIDASLATELKGNSGYVPWFRFVQDADGNISQKAVKDFSRGLINLSKMQDLEGGKIDDIQIGNILDNMAKLSNWMVGKSVGNDTAAYMVDFAVPYGQAKKVGSPVASGVDPKSVVQIMRNGVPTYYQMSDPAALAAFKGYEAAHGAIVSVLKAPATVLRKSITLNPIFSLAQLPQDSFRAFAASGLKNPYAIFPRVMKNFYKELSGGTATSRELAKYGIVGKGSGMPAEASENIRRKLGYYDKGVGGVWGKFSDTLEKISSASDEAVRTALYELTLEEGGSQVLALRRAREIINFDTQGAGATSSFLRQTVPFMGVWMNDLNNLYKGLVLGSARLSEGEKSATRAAIVYRGMQLAALTTLYTLMAGDDEDYKKLDDDTRSRSLIVPGTGFRVPVPNDGIGFLFKVIPEEVTRAVMAEGVESDDAGAKMGRALWNGFKNIGSFENLLPGVGSPLIKTPVELVLNKSFYTGNPIVGKSKENLAPPEQYTEGTSEVAKQLGAALNLSPIKLDYLVRGLAAQVGGSVLAASNALFNAADGKVTPSWSGDIKDIPLLGQFGYSSKDKGNLEDYYELRETVDKVARTYRDMIAAGRGKEAIEYMTDPTNQKAYALRQLQTRIDKDLGKFRNMEKLIYNNANMDSDEKRRQLDKVEEMRTKYLQSMRLPTLRAFAEISPSFDSSAFRILR